MVRRSQPLYEPPPTGLLWGGVHKDLAHDSALKHVSGEARYVDDLPEPRDLLHLAAGMSERAHAKVLDLDLTAVRRAPGVVAVFTAQDIPGFNDISPTGKRDDPLLADGLVEFHGQPLFVVAAEQTEQARAAARLAAVRYEDLEPVLSVEHALERGDFVLEPYEMRRGNAEQALKQAPKRITGKIRIGGQEHFYLEGQVSIALPLEDGDVLIHTSSQHPSEIQHTAARVLDCPSNGVTVEVRRMGGAFGGKETHAAQWAILAALVAKLTGRPAKFRLDRDDDMVMTGKRHDFLADYDVGFDEEGRITALDTTLSSRCGFSADLSASVNDRAMFHADNCYYLDQVHILSHRCKTNTVSNTAFRGFGGPQGMMMIERVIEEIARELGKDPLEVRKTNLYGGAGRNVTPYHMTVEDNIAPELIGELEASSDYWARREAVAAFNQTSPVIKRGLALTPLKFGISYTATFLNQAGALVHVYSDGSVHLNHGGTEMGQGLYIKIAQVVAEEFQIDVDRIKITATTTAKVPNTSPTAGSAGTDLNGMAAQAAARTIKERLAAFAAEQFQVTREDVVFTNNRVVVGEREIPFTELVHMAYHHRIQLSSTGFYKTPKIYYERGAARGRPFYYFSYGAAVAEVAIDTLTGENRVLRVDILHDVGRSLNPAIDLGQIEGGFIQGMGWLTCEELWFDAKGRLGTHAPSTYKIPACADRPEDFRIKIFERGENREETIHRSKAVGEPPFMLGMSVFHAISDAIASLADYRLQPDLDSPATPEQILFAVDELRQRSGGAVS